MRRADAFQVERGHGHRLVQESRLQIQRHQQAEEPRVDAKVRQQGSENRHENHHLRQDLELHRGHVQRQHPGVDQLLATQQGKSGSEDAGADKLPADQAAHRPHSSRFSRCRQAKDDGAQHGHVHLENIQVGKADVSIKQRQRHDATDQTDPDKC